MSIWFWSGACVILAVLAGYYLLRHRHSLKQVEDYKDLALARLADNKELHELVTAARADNKELVAKVEGLLLSSSEKNLQIERATSAAEHLLEKVSENVVALENREGVIAGLQTTLEYEQGQYAKLISQKKSSEVRLGKISEQLSPFLADYPRDPRTARFIGDPLDFVHFDPTGITFVEVKSGKSQLSKKQRMIRDHIKEGKVEFVLYRVEGKTDGPN